MTLRRLPLWVAVVLAPAGVDAVAIALTIALALSVGRDPNLETTFLLVPVPMAVTLLRVADAYELRGRRRRWIVLAGIYASIGWWIAGLLAAAWVARLAAA
jgi:hypothetical protein